jgi:citrate synthase
MSEATKHQGGWRTGVSYVEPNVIRIRGYDINDLLGRLSFGGAVYLLWKGELPDAPTQRLVDSIMIGSMDHGATPPSVLTARTVASCGAPLGSAVAAGILALSKHHGAAVEDCRRMIAAVLEEAGEDRGEDVSGDELVEAAGRVLDAMRARGERAPGMGHRLHSEDPRPEHLFELCRDCQVSGRHIAAIEAVREALAARGKRLPINIDGAVAACLAELDFPLEMSNALFIISRAAGIAVQAREEQARERPMRKINPYAWEYDGVSPRRP